MGRFLDEGEAPTAAPATKKGRFLDEPAPDKSAPKATGPDIVGRAKAAYLAEPPTSSLEEFTRKIPGIGPTLATFNPNRVARAAGDVLLPGSIPEAALFAATLPFGGEGAWAGPVLERVGLKSLVPAAKTLFRGNLATAPLKRTAAAGTVGMAEGLLEGEDTKAALLRGGKTAAGQLAGEVLPGAAAFGLTQKAGQKALTRVAHDTAMAEAVGELEQGRYKADVAARRSTEAAKIREARAAHQESEAAAKRSHAEAVAQQKTEHEAAVKTAEAAHAVNVRDYEQRGATSIAEAFKQQVPAFKDFPSNEQGLLGMVYGEGPQRMSERFDTAMKEIVQTGRGTTVHIPADDARKLGFQITEVKQQADPARPDLIGVDGGQLAERLTGFWKKDHGVYRRGVRALDAENIGDPAMRGEYRAGMALLDFADRSKMLKGEKFNPEAARNAFTQAKTLDMLRKRGQGDIFKGPIAEAVRRPAPQLVVPGEPVPLNPPPKRAFRRPPASPEIPEPTPRSVRGTEKEGVTVANIPTVSHPFIIGAGIGEIPYLLGLVTGAPAHGLGLVGGMGALALSGRPIVTRAPIGSAGEFASRVVPGLEAQQTRRALDAQP